MSMPTDPTNYPFPRSTARDRIALYEAENEANSQSPAGHSHLRAEHILLEEFAHASVMAYQRNEERTDLLNHFLFLAGVIATAVGISASVAYSANIVGPMLAAALGLVFAFILSFGFFIRLLQITKEHHDALVTMGVIKEFYVKELKDHMPQLQHVLRWRLHALPEHGRSGGTTFFIGSTIAVIGSFYLGGAMELLYHYTHEFGGLSHELPISLYLGTIPITGMLVDTPVFFLALLLFVWYYRFARRKHNLDAVIKFESEKLGLTLPK
jgi:hypothetical protein